MQKKQDAPDIVVVVAILAMSILAGMLCVLAAHDPQVRLVAPVFIVGLTGGGLILFRQLRKARESLIASEARAQYGARHDDLTQLPNRTLFVERLQEALEGCQKDAGAPPVAVAYIGLDRLNEINEGLGHDAGDQVVLEIAARLKPLCRTFDTLGRLGDDEFAILWSGVTPSEASDLADCVIELMSGSIETGAGRVFLTGSVGLALASASEEPSIEPLRRAKMALANARKKGGGVTSLFAADMDRALKSRREMEAELRAAIAEGALRMAYQPQANNKGVIFGLEALIRWTSPTRGEVSPAIFVPLAESCGLSEPIGHFALRQAFLDGRRWPGLKVAVNVSAIQIRSGRIIEMLKALLEETGANPAKLELEITESILLDDEPETLNTLLAIRKLGFKIALDDFGTGYSSLSYLRRFPVDKIKIDRAFITNLGVRPESDAIVKAIVNLATALDIKVIAEGVETQSQVDRLALAGCHQIQGYVFGGAIDADEIDRTVIKAVTLAA
ncbi:MAG: putative bifunctional diguanylate cyclase/phosphodiesterase [Caulobacterales bacterium]